MESSQELRCSEEMVEARIKKASLLAPSGAWYFMVLSYFDTVEMVLGDWRDNGVG